jgi:hypothetical protein
LSRHVVGSTLHFGTLCLDPFKAAAQGQPVDDEPGDARDRDHDRRGQSQATHDGDSRRGERCERPDTLPAAVAARPLSLFFPDNVDERACLLDARRPVRRRGKPALEPAADRTRQPTVRVVANELLLHGQQATVILVVAEHAILDTFLLGVAKLAEQIGTQEPFVVQVSHRADPVL